MKKTFALFAKKAMVYALTAAMLVSTPVTAGAAGIDDVLPEEPEAIEEVVETSTAIEPVEEVVTTEEEVITEEVKEEAPEATEAPEAAEVPETPEVAEEVAETEEAVEELPEDFEAVEEIDYSDAFVDDLEKTVDPYWDRTGTGTDTITETSTDSGALKDNRSEILGMTIYPSETIKMEVDDKDVRVQAAVIFSNEEEIANLPKIKTKDGEKTVVEVLNSKIRWHVYKEGTFKPEKRRGESYADVMGPDGKGTNTTDTAQPLGVDVRDIDGDGIMDRNVAFLNAKKGCTVDLVADITYFKNDVNLPDEIKSKLKEDYLYAKATVVVKQYSNTIAIDASNLETGNQAYPKQSYQLKALLDDGANDEVTWYVDRPRFATINMKTGVLTAKKVGEVNVTAVTEKGVASTPLKVSVVAGTPAKTVTILGVDGKDAGKTMAWDVSYSTGESKGTAATSDETLYKTFNLSSKFDADTVTDVVTWTSNKPGIVKVAGTSGKQNKDCTLEVVSVGKAVITAKATSGKKATITVEAKASMIKLEAKDVTLYTGQSLQIPYTRVPAMNKDRAEFTVVKNDYLQTTKAGVAKALTKAKTWDAAKAEKNDVTIKVGDKKATINVAVKQSAITGFDIVRASSKFTLSGPSKGTAKDSVAVGRTAVYTAKADPAGQVADALNWKVSGKAVSVSHKGNGVVEITGVKKGSATITVTGTSYNSGTKKYVPVSAKFKLTVNQPATSVTLKKKNIVVNPGKAKTVSVGATLNPKGADKGFTVTMVPGSASSITATGTKVTVAVSAKAGETGLFLAKAKSGVAAVGNVYVAKKTAGVILADKKDGTTHLSKKDIEVGKDKSLTVYPRIKLSKTEFSDPGSKNGCEEIVSYTVKKAGYVNVIRNSNGSLTIYGLQKAKNIAVVVQTASGKKATIKVTVK